MDNLLAGYVYSTLQSVLWAISCVGLGMPVARRLKSPTNLELILASFLLGCIVWVAIGLALFGFHWFKPLVLTALVDILGVASLAAFGRKWFWDLRKGLRISLPVIFLSIVLAAQLLYAFLPVTAFDALLYHLPLAKRMLDTGTISWTQWIFNSSFPQSYELLQAIGMASGGDVGATLVSWWFGLGTVLLLIAIGARLGSPQIGLWSSIALSLTPLWFCLAHVPYMGTALAFGICFLALSILIDSPGWLVGAIVGWLAAANYYGVEVGLLGILVWVCKSRQGARHVLWALAVAAAIAGFWYVRNLYLFSNPFFPYFESFFRFLGPPRLSESADTMYDIVRRAGSPDTLSGWIGLPLKLMVNPAPEYADDSAMAWKQVGWLAALWPLAVIVLRRHTGLAGVYLLTLAATFSWVLVHRVIDLRYLTYLLPLMYVLSFVFLASPFSRLNLRPSISIAISAIAIILATWHLIGPTTDRSLVQIPFTSSEREMFLEDNIDCWPVVRELNRSEPRPTVYFLCGEGVRYYCRFPVYAGWHNRCDYGKFLDHAGSGADLANWLEGIGVDVLLIDERRGRLLGDERLGVLQDSGFTEKYTPYLVGYNDTSLYVHSGFEFGN